MEGIVVAIAPSALVARIVSTIVRNAAGPATVTFRP